MLIVHSSVLTVLITTKYPEEIGMAYKVGLMRNGHIYAEDRPEDLRQRFGCITYDQLYNRFCESNTPRRIRDSIAPYLKASTLNHCTSINVDTQQSNSRDTLYPIFDRLKFSAPITSSQSEDSKLSTPKISRYSLPMAEWSICERRRTA